MNNMNNKNTLWRNEQTI